MFLTLLMFITLTGCMMSVSQAFLAYDCTLGSTNITTISTVTVPQCDINTDHVKEQDEYIQLIQLADKYTVRVRQCRVDISRTIFNCGQGSHSSIVRGGVTTYSKDISVKECDELHDRGIISIGNGIFLRDIQSGTSTTRAVTFAGNLDRAGTCEGASYSDRFGSWSNVVVEGQITITIQEYDAVITPSDDKIILNGGLTCRATAKYCMDTNNGYTYWSYEGTQTCDEKLHLVLYEGVAAKTTAKTEVGEVVTYVVDNGDKVFALRTTGYYKGCLSSIHTTEHPKLMIAPKGPNGFYFTRKQIPTESLDLMIYMNAKFVYLEKRMHKQMSLMYRELETQRCTLERRTLRNLLSIAAIDPMEFAYTYMDGPGYTAKTMGEVVHIIQCVAVPVKTMLVDTGCYKEWPVVYNNKTVFMSPKSRILQRYGTEIECDSVLNSQFELEGRWLTINGQVRVVPSPNYLTPIPASNWRTDSLDSIASVGIYSMEDLSRLERKMMNPYEHQAIENVIVRGFEGAIVNRQGMSMANLLDEDALKKMSDSVIHKIWGWLSVFGNITSGVIGLFMILKLFKFLIDTVIHGKAIYDLYGLSLFLVGSIWDSVTTYILHRRHYKTETAKTKETPTDQELTELVVDNNKTEPVSSITPTAPYPQPGQTVVTLTDDSTKYPEFNTRFNSP